MRKYVTEKQRAKSEPATELAIIRRAIADGASPLQYVDQIQLLEAQVKSVAEDSTPDSVLCNFCPETITSDSYLILEVPAYKRRKNGEVIQERRFPDGPRYLTACESCIETRGLLAGETKTSTEDKKEN